MTHRYQVYGLQIDSTQPMRALLPGRSDTPCDLRVEWHHDASSVYDAACWVRSPLVEPCRTTEMSLWRAERPGGALLKLQIAVAGRLCEFLLDTAACRLSVVFPKDLPIGLVKPYFFGSVMSSVLRLRGTICLHASALVVRDRAVVILGPKTAGKSTTAAAMADRGATILADDVAALTPASKAFEVHPGPMHLQLSPAYVRDYWTRGAIGSSNPQSGKIRLPLGESQRPDRRFCPESRRLACIVVLDSGQERSNGPESPLPPFEALMALSRNVYGFCLAGGSAWPREFTMLSRIAQRVPIHHVRRQNDFAQLPALCDAIAAMACRGESGGHRAARS